MPKPAEFAAYGSVGACAVAFARAHATEYGGDPQTLILFGHSAGAQIAGNIAFTDPVPTAGCPGGTSRGPLHALVAWDGDWGMIDPSWEGVLENNPSSWEIFTPITHIDSDTSLKVVLLASGVVGSYKRDLSDPAAAESFFELRGPGDFLRQQLENIGALDDGIVDIQEDQQLLYSVLEEQGNPVTLTELPGASHDSFGIAMYDEALAVFVAAFVAVAGD